jgi:hypothetical protein
MNKSSYPDMKICCFEKQQSFESFLAVAKRHHLSAQAFGKMSATCVRGDFSKQPKF